MRLVYLLLLLLPTLLVAQPILLGEDIPTAKGWHELTISNGLSQGMIFGLKQDKNGFVWIATKDGLNRYDGHNFTIFTHDPYNPFSLSENYCSAMLLDSRGRLWVGTLTHGLNLFDDRTRRFYHLDISDGAIPGAGNYEINLLSEDPDGNIWVGTNKHRLVKITLPASLRDGFPGRPDFTGQVQTRQVMLPQTTTDNYPRCISFGAGGHAVVGTSYGLYSFNWRQPAGATKDSLFSRSSLDFHALYHDDKQDIWFAATSDQIIGWRRGVTKTIALPKTNNFSVNFKAITPATMVITATKFIWMMSPAELFGRDSLTARNAFVSLPPGINAITDFLEDQTGNLWVGTGGYGLRIFNPKIKQFHSYLPNASLSNLYVDRQGRTYIRYQYAYQLLDRANDRMLPFLDKSLPVADQRQRYLMQDHAGVFWVSNVNFETHQATLFKFSSDWKLLKKYPLPPNTTFGATGNQTLEDKTGYLWIGAADGKLLRFDPVVEAFSVVDYQKLMPQGGVGVETYALYQDGAGTLWIATQKGLIRADHLPDRPVFLRYKNSPTDRQSLSYDFVSSMLDDPYQPERYLWVGTKGGGLDRLDKQTGRFMHITQAQGLPDKVVYGILADGFKNLWLSTNRGLVLYNPQSRICRNYTKADGLQDDEFNTSSFVKAPSGELLFGGINGLTTFRPAEVIPTTTRRPTAKIIGLKINNEPMAVGDTGTVLTQSIDYTHQLDLAHDQNLITLEFAVMDYANTAKNRYRYRLNGIDRDWVEAGTNRFANYTQLPDGQYTFQMMGSADGELWSKPVDVHIRVRPPFYRTWWAWLFYLTGAATAGWLLYRFQTQRWLLQQRLLFEQQEATRLAELDALKTQFFTNISHEFRTPLTLILGPVEEAVADYAHDSRFPLIQRNARRLLNLINQLLDLSKLEANQLRPEPGRGDIAAFIRMLASSFTSLAESRQIRFTFAQNDTERWADFDGDKIEKIVTNLLANAFKFTPPGNEVRMTVDYFGTDLPGGGAGRLIIEDTGIGIAPEHLTHIFERFYQGATYAVDGQANRPYEGTGIGLALVHELVRVLTGQIHVTSTVGLGTTFTVTLPLPLVHKPAILPQPAPAAAGSSPVPNADLPLATLPASGDPATDSILLIIDDNADIRAYVRSIFEGDYRILEAVDGQDGLAQATAVLPDVVICDLMMPVLDGFGFCRLLKTQDVTSHIPVVMLTAKATVEDRIEGFSLGADDYLTKPFNRSEIRVRVRNLVQQRDRLYRRLGTNPAGPGFTPASAGLAALRLPVAEQHFLDRLTGLVIQHLDDTTFTVEALADAVSMSRTQLHRKVKALTDTTTTGFMREIRLERAAELLIEGGQSVTQVAYAVGFDNLSYFAKVFQERYGTLPSQYGRTPSVPL